MTTISIPWLADQLKPYIIDLVVNQIIVGSPSPHALSSLHHSGELANAQATQFLLTDGTRTLTGNLAVSSGITIDGVDISAHVIDNNNHLGSSVGTLSISTPNAAASPHTHAITSSSSPGSAASILATDANGGITFDTSLLIVDALNNRIGIGITPTEQFEIRNASGTQMKFSYSDTVYSLIRQYSSYLEFKTTTNDIEFRPDALMSSFLVTYGSGYVTDYSALQIASGSTSASIIGFSTGELRIQPSDTLRLTWTGPGGYSPTSSVKFSYYAGSWVDVLTLNNSHVLELNAGTFIVNHVSNDQLSLEYSDLIYTSFRADSGGDLIVYPTGTSIKPKYNYDTNLGQIDKKWLALHAAELWVETLVAQNTIATIGGRVLVGPTTTLTADLLEAGTTITVKHNEMAVDDIVYMEAAGNVEFMKILTGPSGGGPYTYTVTRDLDGSGSTAWYAGDAIFNTGQALDGWIDIYSVQGMKPGTVGTDPAWFPERYYATGTYPYWPKRYLPMEPGTATTRGPTIVGNVRNTLTYNDWTEYWAIGNLNGVYGYTTDTYGAAFGKYASGKPFISVDATEGLRIRNNSSTFLQFDMSGNGYIAGVLAIGTSGELRQGTGTIGVDFTGLRIWRDSSIGRIAGYNSNSIQWYAGTDGKLYAGAGDVRLDADGLAIVNGASLAKNRITFYSPSDVNIKAWTYLDVLAGGGGYAHWYLQAYDQNSGHYGKVTLNAAGDNPAVEVKLELKGGPSGATDQGATLNSSFTYHGDLKSYKNSTSYSVYAWKYLSAPLTSTLWDGDSFSSTAKTLIDLSSVFSVPAGVKAVLCEVSIRDSGSSGTGDYYLVLGPTNTAAEGVWIDVNGLGNDEIERGNLIVPCDSNGDIYYEINASGTGTFDVWLRIWGYAI